MQGSKSSEGLWGLASHPFHRKTMRLEKGHDLVPVIPLNDNGPVLMAAPDPQMGLQIPGQFPEIVLGPLVPVQNGDRLSLSFFVFAKDGLVLYPINGLPFVILGIFLRNMIGEQVF